ERGSDRPRAPARAHLVGHPLLLDPRIGAPGHHIRLRSGAVSSVPSRNSGRPSRNSGRPSRNSGWPSRNSGWPSRNSGGPNAIGATLGLLGDEWSLLIVRYALAGARRFGDWRTRVGISDAVLSARLRSLVDGD